MLTEFLGLVNAVALTVIIIGVVSIINFLKGIYDTLIVPIITPILPILGIHISNLIKFISTNIPIAINVIKKSLAMFKETVISITGKYRKLTGNTVESEQVIYVLDQNNKPKAISIKGNIDINHLPDEIKKNINSKHYHEEDLIQQVNNKMSRGGYV